MEENIEILGRFAVDKVETVPSVVKSHDVFCLVSVGNFTAGRSYRLFTTLRDSVSKALCSLVRFNDFVKSLLTLKRGANEIPRELLFPTDIFILT